MQNKKMDINMQASCNFDERPKGAQIDSIIIHAISLPPNCFGNEYVEAFFTNQLDHTAHPYFAQLEGVNVSAHYYIKRCGELIQFVETHNRAWHAGASKLKGRTNVNDFSIGVELEGCDTLCFTNKQYHTLNALITELAQKHPINPDHIVGHSDIAPGRKTDPGPYFDWSKVQHKKKHA